MLKGVIMESVAERRNLKMHKNLLMKVIKDQAGTLEKGILEGAMNLIEAGATRGDIDFLVEDNKVILNIKDNGRGICTKEELIENFEVFGTPHKDSENKIWAKFRMGRGQLFAFGKNTWRTSTAQRQMPLPKRNTAPVSRSHSVLAR